MQHKVYAQARVRADSIGAAEEIAAYEEVEWEVQRMAHRRRASRILAGVGLGWILTSPWDLGVVEVLDAHARLCVALGGAIVGVVFG